MSTNTHEQSKTCTDIVHDLAMWAEALEGAQDLGDPRMVASQMRVQAAVLKRQPALAGPARHPGAAAAVLTLQTGGWKYKVGDERWTHPGTYGQDPGVRAADKLRGLGWSWGPSLCEWLPPAPSADALRAQVAEATLRGLGYEWEFVGQSWIGPVLDPRGHERLKQAAELAVSVRYRNGPAAQQDAAISALVDALGGGARPAFPPAWDAEECRNAALEVLRAARGEDFSPLLSKALTRLAAAVQRVQ